MVNVLDKIRAKMIIEKNMLFKLKRDMWYYGDRNTNGKSYTSDGGFIKSGDFVLVLDVIYNKGGSVSITGYHSDYNNVYLVINVGDTSYYFNQV